MVGIFDYQFIYLRNLPQGNTSTRAITKDNPDLALLHQMITESIRTSVIDILEGKQSYFILLILTI